VAQTAGTEGIVLLRNEGNVLPLRRSARRIAVIGGHADAGVLSGGGSAQVYPQGGNAAPGIAPTSWPGPVVYLPSSPMKAIALRAPNASVRYADGTDRAAAAALARGSDVAIVFVTQWTAESRDFPVTLPDDQDALVEAVAAANPRTIVVMETGGPVLTPWRGRVAAALQAWYPGTGGGDAIADVLFGDANPSGRLPVTFLASLDQLPRPRLDGEGLPDRTPFDVRYTEGAAVGHRWFDARRLVPAFPFGHGLSYTRFRYDALLAKAERDGLAVRFTVTNIGERAGMDVPQVYVGPPDRARWEAPRRLGGFAKVALEPGASITVTVRVDPRLLAGFAEGRGWVRPAGTYRVWLGASSRDLKADAAVALPSLTLPASWHAPGAFTTLPVMGSAGTTTEPERPGARRAPIEAKTVKLAGEP
jgi:beta-glucosidase